MKEKSKAFEVFRAFNTLVEKESGCVINCLKTDIGGEYTSTTFNGFCSINGIKRKLSTTYM